MKKSEIEPSEYNPHFKPYIDKVGELTLIDSLNEGANDTFLFFETIPESKLNYRYAQEKWTIKDILLHLIDSERTFSYRALQFARSKYANLEGFNENEFVANASADSRDIKSLLKEYKTVRNASITLFKSFSDEVLQKTGKADNIQLSVRAAGFLICGHEKHHIQIIKERYL